jgi:hypothetical protein
MESTFNFNSNTNRCFAYIRVSTKEQNVDRQLNIINEKYPKQIHQTFIDYCLMFIIKIIYLY